MIRKIYFLFLLSFIFSCVLKDIIYIQDDDSIESLKFQQLMIYKIDILRVPDASFGSSNSANFMQSTRSHIYNGYQIDNLA